MSFDWSSIARQVYGSLAPKTVSYASDYAAYNDRKRYYNDHHKNTGRYIKYSYMRGYNPSMMEYKQGAASGKYLQSMFKSGYDTVNDVMDLII